MKNLFILLLLAFLVTSCNKFVSKNIYENVYSTTQAAYPDVYNQLKNYGLDSIPLEQWITNDLVTDTMEIKQRMIRNVINENSNYQFVFTRYVWPVKCICPERVKYQFVIRYFGKPKDQIR